MNITKENVFEYFNHHRSQIQKDKAEGIKEAIVLQNMCIQICMMPYNENEWDKFIKAAKAWSETKRIAPACL